MQKSLLILTFLLVVFTELNAGRIPKEIAHKVADNYYNLALNSTGNRSDVFFSDVVLECVNDIDSAENAQFYIFKPLDRVGFIIISSSDKVMPVLAYSFESDFDLDNCSPSQRNILDYYSKIIKEVESGLALPTIDVTDDWRQLSSDDVSRFGRLSTQDGLLGSIEWNQSMPYNAMCPNTEGAYSGYGGKCPVGCTAIAMLQIMKYYNWPPSGANATTHYSEDNGGFGDMYVDFSQNTYDWSVMPNSASQPNQELAKMCFHAGVAVKMYWSAEGSGAWPEDAAYALVNYFSYQNIIELVQKDDYSEDEWNNLIRSQIDQKMPVLYVGYSDEAGHAWNCDGYQGEDHFHMNWGWGGHGNGFYTLDALGTSATPGNSEGNYNQWQHALINIIPDGDYPVFCQNDFVTTGNQGSFEDGSSFDEYQNNTLCTYVIQPECRGIIELEFERFNLGQGDFLQIWDGEPQSDFLIADFDEFSQPDESLFKSYSGKLTLVFSSDESVVADGWKVVYNTAACQSSLPVTQHSGSFDDGSKDCNYEKSQLCSWIIHPENVNRIYIDFEYFDINGSTDIVRIYKNSTKLSDLLYTFSQNSPPNQVYEILADTAIVSFFSSANSLSGDGWEINYNSILSSTNEQSVSKMIGIYPNPVNDVVTLSYYAYDNAEGCVKIFDALGKCLIEKNVLFVIGENEISIPEISFLADKSNYFVQLRLNDRMLYGRFLKL